MSSGLRVTLAAGLSLLVAGRSDAQLGQSVASLLGEGAYEETERAARAQFARLGPIAAGSPAAIDAADALVRALIANGRAADRETLVVAEMAVAAREKAGGTSPEFAASLAAFAEALASDGQLTRASTAARRALALSLSGQSPADSMVADTLDSAGRVLSAARNHDEALGVFERSLAARRSIAAQEGARARTLEGMALVLQRKGDYARSGRVVREAVAVQEADNPLHPPFVGTLNLLAQQLWFEGDLPGSKAASERAVALASRVLRADHPGLALSLRYLAATLFDLGDASESRVLTERALQIAERAFGRGHHQTADYLNDLGATELLEGRYPAARRLLQQALDVYQAKYGAFDERVASTLSALAQVDARMGNYSRARSEQARAVAIHTRAGGANHPFVAIALTELAAVHREQGQPAAALPLLERALAIRERNLGVDHRDVARTLADLALTNARLGRVTRALAQATRAVSILEQLQTPDAPEYATVLALYADIQTLRADDHAARDAYQRALQIRAGTFGTSHPLYAETQSALGVVLARLGAADDAMQAALAAETTGREHLRLMIRSLPERQALQYGAARPGGFNLMASLATSRVDAVAPALDLVIRNRALVLDEMVRRRSPAATATPAVTRARGALDVASQRLANLLVRGPGALKPAHYARLVDEARQAREGAETTLADLSAAFRDERSRARLGIEDIARALPADAALVSVVRYERSSIEARAPTPANRRAVFSYIAFVLRPGREPVAADLGAEATIDGLVRRWRADIAAEAGAPLAPGHLARTSRISGTAVRQAVWDPLAGAIGDARRVFIVPDGSLGLAPFAALPMGRQTYLIETGPTLHYLTAERDLVGVPGRPAARGLLAVGGPSFDARNGRRRPVAQLPAPAVRGSAAPGCGNFESFVFGPLAGTVQEVEEISRIWAGTQPESGDARVLVGPAAQERELKRTAHEHRVLHLATHGFFLGGECGPAATGRRGVGGLAASRPAVREENPLLLAGLALAGANHRSQARADDDDDGILTAEEIAMLNLQGVEWAVLSACDTGVGEVRAGEGVFGLRRAFQVAGARTVIMSLWSVDDRATRSWMRALYESRLQRGLSTADAVREASLILLRDRRARGLSTDPFYWSAFVAAGDWR